jgi:uncharacterized membrane protein YhaH (DUF805 family)
MSSKSPSSASPRTVDLGYLFRLWFGLKEPVARVPYILSGFGLMLVKYLCEAAMISSFTHKFYQPLDFLNPLISVRQKYFAPPAPDWLAWFVVLWSLPFLWIAVSMSVRRAVDAGKNAWLGLWIFVPLVNFIMMVYLCAPPSSRRRRRLEGSVDALSRDATSSEDSTQPLIEHKFSSALLGIAASAAICITMVSLSVYLIRDYGAALFMGTPIIMGATSAYIYNRPYTRGVLASIMVAELSIFLSGLILLLFAFEGILCLAMLLPIAGGMAILGALIGIMIASIQPQQSIMLLIPISMLPALAGAEHAVRDLPEYEVLTTIEIDASPETVWPNVVGFSDLDDPPSWFFRLGIAYPKRATIIGAGVGAVRHCEFSTGSFVEPITVWDQPNRLAFDVRSQPAPMHELSPYRYVHPPHLDGYLRCKRGEFRLIDLGDGRTRLEGRTWYEYEIFPQSYWTLWTDILIHRIHHRVLTHIKKLSETK